MQLVGMLDSPYVRRTAISLTLLGVPFEHRSVSVFSTFEQFKQINPVVKAPTLVCANGEILMDSTLIIAYAEALAAPRSLMPSAVPALQHELHIISLALAACEKGVQIVYEHNLRPPEMHFQPWLTRVKGQLIAACRALELAIQSAAFDASTPTQAMITTAVIWRFMQDMIADLVIAADYPAIAALATVMEQLPSFIAYPADGPGVPSAI